MSLPTATQDGTTGAPATDETTQTTTGAPERTGGSDANDDDALSEEDAAMEAGFKAIARSTDDDTTGKSTDITSDATTGTTKTDGKTEAEEEQEEQREGVEARTGDDVTGDDKGGKKDDDDPLVPGLNMKASEVRAALSSVAGLNEQLRNAHGKIGHLNSLVQNLGKSGKPITKDQLKRVSEEYGEEFAEAFAADLNEAGFGGGQPVDQEAVNKLVADQVAPMLQKAEWRAVRLAHKDAADYFKDGKHHQDFMKFVGTLPPERQEELMNSWDADVIVPALDEFKEQRAKAENAQARQNKRVERAVAPTQQRASAPPPEEDPMEAGYRAAGGRRVQQLRQGARR